MDSEHALLRKLKYRYTPDQIVEAVVEIFPGVAAIHPEDWKDELGRGFILVNRVVNERGYTYEDLLNELGVDADDRFAAAEEAYKKFKKENGNGRSDI